MTASSSAESAANPVQLIEWRGFQRTSVASGPLRELWGEPSNLARHLNLRARSAPARPGAAVNRGIQQWLDVIWFGKFGAGEGIRTPDPNLDNGLFFCTREWPVALRRIRNLSVIPLRLSQLRGSTTSAPRRRVARKGFSDFLRDPIGCAPRGIMLDVRVNRGRSWICVSENCACERDCLSAETAVDPIVCESASDRDPTADSV
jgi:hypothetical protein